MGKIKTIFYFLFFISCQKETFNRVEIQPENLLKIKEAMSNSIILLEKTKIDTLLVKEFYLNGRINDLLFYSQSKNKDSIINVVEKEFNFNSYFPLKKGFSELENSTIMFNNRIVADNFLDFINKLEILNEVKELNKNEKQLLISSLKILLQNNIYTFSEEFYLNKKIIAFRYDIDKTYYGEKFERYLYLESEIKKLYNLKDFLKYNQIIETKNGLVLTKNK